MQSRVQSPNDGVNFIVCTMNSGPTAWNFGLILEDHSIVCCTKYFDILNRLGVHHQFDRRIDRQIDRSTELGNQSI